jgi:hypothetical protein
MIARWLPIAVLVLATACAEEATPPEDELADPDAYFGLDLCTCFLFSTDGSDAKVGVAIERQVDRAGGGAAYELRFRNESGEVFRTELVEATDPDLLLWDVQYAGGAPSWRLDEGLPLVRWPPDDQQDTPVSDELSGSYRESPAQMDPVLFDLNVRSDYGPFTDVTFQRAEAPETAEGVRISYRLGSSSDEAPEPSLGARTFVPEVGFTRLEELDSGSGQPRIWTLYAVKPLPTCPYAGPPPTTEICGSTIY